MKYMQPEMEIVSLGEETIVRTSPASTEENDIKIFKNLPVGEKW